MDITSLIIGIAVLGVFSLPVIIFTRNHYKHKNYLLREVSNRAKSQSLQIDQKEIWRKRFLGLDTKSLKLISADSTAGEVSLQVIDLSRVGEVQIRESYSKEGAGQGKNLNKMFLECKGRKSGDTLEIITLYEDDIDQYPDFEKLRATKWKKLVEDAIAAQRKTVAPEKKAAILQN